MSLKRVILIGRAAEKQAKVVFKKWKRVPSVVRKYLKYADFFKVQISLETTKHCQEGVKDSGLSLEFQ